MDLPAAVSRLELFTEYRISHSEAPKYHWIFFDHLAIVATANGLEVTVDCCCSFLVRHQCFDLSVGAGTLGERPRKKIARVSCCF